ncbi:MAG: nascent polypeptide-associated complex protein [Nanoarchaeota archaeon]|nr:nascent polypeptide-associated complex protein [Nanoarchaeota archaeon]
MLGKINPKQIEGMMKKMGIAQVSLDVKRVIIELEDKNLVFDEPDVLKVNMQGQETFQITGQYNEETKEMFTEEDVKMVMQKTGKSKEKITQFLKENNGDIALAIIELK